MPDVALLARLVGRWVETTNATLVTADAANERELADDAAPREARDMASVGLREVLIDVRAAVDTAYGPTGLRALALDAAVPEDPAAVHNLAKDALHHLEDSGIKLAAPRRGVKIDRAAFADELREQLPTFTQALADVAREGREAEQSLRDKRLAMEANDLAFGRGADLLSAVFGAAGLDDLAARVRPSARRPGQVAEPDAPAEPPAGGAPG